MTPFASPTTSPTITVPLASEKLSAASAGGVATSSGKPAMAANAAKRTMTTKICHEHHLPTGQADNARRHTPMTAASWRGSRDLSAI